MTDRPEKLYESPSALEMAIRSAARKANIDTNTAQQYFYHDRFLCRVFSEPEFFFVLKGGQGMLAFLQTVVLTLIPRQHVANEVTYMFVGF